MNKAAAFFIGFAAGFVLGRAGHVVAGGEPGLHHWLVGLPIIVVGALAGSLALVGFGVGLSISDLDDMLAGRTDEPSPSDLSRNRQFIGVD